MINTNYGSVPPYYPQPQYTGYQQPQYMPYQQPIQQVSTMVGRLVNDISDIKPNETPTTGQPAVFPKADGSVIYLSCMDQTGRINIREYVPREVPTEVKSDNNVIIAMQEQLNRIENMLNRRNNQNAPKKGE